MASTSVFDHLAPAAEDEIFGLLGQFAVDPRPNKVSLCVGVYRTNEGTGWKLPSIQQAEEMLSKDPSNTHDYLPIAGYEPLINGAKDLIFGSGADSVVPHDHIASLQSISGTGALHVGARFLLDHLPARPAGERRRLWMSDPTWGNHHWIMEQARSSRNSSPTEIVLYPYYSPQLRGLDFDAMLATLTHDTHEGDVVLLHACAHNPTGLDPTRDQWKRVADVCVERKLVPFFDIAYQGFASGSLEADAWPVREFALRGLEMAVAQSFSKNMGLYGQRTGVLHLVSASPAAARTARGWMSEVQRAEISMPPVYGARLAHTVLSHPELVRQWHEDMVAMSDRIKTMRRTLFDRLTAFGTPGRWAQIVEQIGMFSYTGLSVKQVRRLREDWAIYMLDSGRASISGLTPNNVEYVAKAIDAVARATD